MKELKIKKKNSFIKKIIIKLNRFFGYETIDQSNYSIISIDKYGIPLTEETLSECLNADSVFLGAVGGPKWDNIEHSKKPEQARCMGVSHSN